MRQLLASLYPFLNTEYTLRVSNSGQLNNVNFQYNLRKLAGKLPFRMCLYPKIRFALHSLIRFTFAALFLIDYSEGSLREKKEYNKEHSIFHEACTVDTKDSPRALLRNGFLYLMVFGKIN